MITSLPRRGVAATLGIEFVRELTMQEIDSLADRSPIGPLSAPMVQKLTAAHHRQAQLVARGIYSVVAIARMCGVTPQRIYQLKRDQFFIELVEYYQTQVAEATHEATERVQTKLLVAGEVALDELNDRLDDPAQRAEIPVGELRKIVEMAADRTVAPPKTSIPSNIPPSTITLNFGTELKQRNREIDAEDVTDVVEEE